MSRKVNTNPLVTIGIPCYNVEKFIESSLKSVLRQTYKNYELIITDDGSTDQTLNIIRGFDNPKIKIIYDGENKGISYRLNQQIDLARGDIFVRMDGDDLMFPERVEKQVEYLMEHPNVDVVGSGAIIIDDDNKIIGIRQSTVSQKSPEDVVVNPVFIHPTVCGRIEFFRKYKYAEELNGVEDKDLWCRGIVDSTYAIMPETLMFYRDPLKFKLSTYLSRKRKGREQVIKRWGLFKDKRPPIRYIIDSYIKSLGAYLLSKMGKESSFIAQRNEYIEQKEKYIKILNNEII